MNREKRKLRRLLTICGVMAIVLFVKLPGCTDANLYIRGIDDPSQNRLGLKGRVCTDDPREAGFPVRVIFLVDVAAGPIFATFDPELLRLKAIRDALAIHGGNHEFSFAVISYGPNARLLAPQPEDNEYFTRNASDLDNAVATLALARGCMGPMCREYRDGMELARSLIEGDLADMTAGERNRTQYVTVVVSGGRPNPLNKVSDCADPDSGKPDPSPSWECTEEKLTERVLGLRELVYDRGAASFSLHVLFLAAHDPTAKDGQKELQETESILQQMAFVGQGAFGRHDVADTVTLDHIGLRKLSSLFQVKSLLVSNSNVLPSPAGMVADSDGDGLNDSQEDDLGTSPFLRDTDLDGIGDAIETLLVLGPLTPSEPPVVCQELEGPPYKDMDSDHLNDCEELLLGTEMSIPDTDGDAVPDWIEVVMGTDYLVSDAQDDADKDGVANGDEARAHTDPRSSDLALHLGDSYRYDLVDEGYVTTPAISSPRRITGITILGAGDDTSAGLGILGYSPTPVPTLTWKDPLDKNRGTEVQIRESGEYALLSGSYDEETGPDRQLLVEVDIDLLPPTVEEEILFVELAERHCLNFTLRNIRLVETASELNDGGKNDVYIYFSQAPKGRLDKPGLFRVAHIPVIYHEDTGRTPEAPLVEVSDEDFVPIGY